MMIDNIVATARPKNNWDHMLAEKFPCFLAFLLPSAFPFFVDLAHAHSDLGWTQVRDIYRLKNRFPNGHH